VPAILPFFQTWNVILPRNYATICHMRMSREGSQKNGFFIPFFSLVYSPREELNGCGSAEVNASAALIKTKSDKRFI
jgi:hypothetical protein